MIAATASPGLRKLTIAAEKAPPGAMAVVVIRSGRGRREPAADARRMEQDARRRWALRARAEGQRAVRSYELRHCWLVEVPAAVTQWGHRARLHRHARFTALTR